MMLKLLWFKILLTLFTVLVMVSCALKIFPVLADGPLREFLIVTSPSWRKPFSPVYHTLTWKAHDYAALRLTAPIWGGSVEVLGEILGRALAREDLQERGPHLLGMNYSGTSLVGIEDYESSDFDCRITYMTYVGFEGEPVYRALVDEPEHERPDLPVGIDEVVCTHRDGSRYTLHLEVWHAGCIVDWLHEGFNREALRILLNDPDVVVKREVSHIAAR
jgi:hypothetical protein